MYEIIDFELKKRFVDQAEKSNVDLIWTENPMFMLSKNEIKQDNCQVHQRQDYYVVLK